jgi:MHS family proline/betaine transporter-like MFS transporter
LGFYLRLNLIESIVFLREKKQSLFSAGLWTKALKKDSINMLKIFGSVFCAGVSYYTYNFFMVSYLTNQINFSYKQALTLSLWGSFLLACFIPFWGWLSDKAGRKKVTYFGLYGLIFFSFPLFYGFSSESFYGAFIIQIIFAAMLSCYLGSLPSLITEQLKTSSRSICIAISYGVSIALSGGTTPMLDLYLIKYWDNIYAPGIYISLSGVFSLISVYFMKERYRKQLE